MFLLLMAIGRYWKTSDYRLAIEDFEKLKPSFYMIDAIVTGGEVCQAN